MITKATKSENIIQDNKPLWYLTDEYGHTTIQTFSKSEPTELINFLNGN